MLSSPSLVITLILVSVTRVGSDLQEIRVLPKSWDPSFSYSLYNRTKVIVLATLFRSGSTFLGELFNQNPDVLYDFESFHEGTMEGTIKKGNVIGLKDRHTLDEVNMLYLQQILNNCSIVPSCFGDVMHKYWRCAGTAEENMMLFGEPECIDKGHKNIFLARQYHCKHRSAVAIKVIRIRRLRDLELIRDIEKTDLSVIHLLRDPRALFRSRSGFRNIFEARRNKLTWTEGDRYSKTGLEAHHVCENYISDMEYAQNHPWLKHRYLAVKHDDMGRAPISTAQLIYDFVGLQLPDSIKDFLNKTTTSHEEGVLSTQKDSAMVLDKWLKWFIADIRNIDKHCERFIERMGWPMVLSPEPLNDEMKPYFKYPDPR